MGKWEMHKIYEGRDHMRDLAVHGRIILKWIFYKNGVCEIRTGFIWRGICCYGEFLLTG